MSSDTNCNTVGSSSQLLFLLTVVFKLVRAVLLSPIVLVHIFPWCLTYFGLFCLKSSLCVLLIYLLLGTWKNSKGYILCCFPTWLNRLIKSSPKVQYFEWKVFQFTLAITAKYHINQFFRHNFSEIIKKYTIVVAAGHFIPKL